MKNNVEDLKVEIRNIVKLEFDAQDQKRLAREEELREKIIRIGMGFVFGLSFSCVLAMILMAAKSSC